MQEETIYSLIPKEYQQPEKPTRYTSKFNDAVKNEYSQNKGSHKTIGPDIVPTKKPAAFLKKRSKEPKLPEKQDLHCSKEAAKKQKKPEVPRKEDKPMMGLQTKKNFITLNAMTNIMSVPRKPIKYFVDTREGETHRLTPSGLEPKYIHKKDYGKVPVYVERQRRSLEQVQQQYDEYAEAKRRDGAMKEVDQDERASLLQGLKSNWEELHRDYQKISMAIDTEPKRNRKEVMEITMKKLEGYIALIENHHRIFIAD